METVTSPSRSTLPPLATGTANQRLVRRFGWLLILALVLFVVYRSARLVQAGWATYQAGQALRAQVAGPLALEQLTTLQEPLDHFAQTLAKLQREVTPLAALLHRLDWLPTYGPTVAATPELLTTATELSALASRGLPLAQTILASDPAASLVTRLAAGLAQSSSQLAELAGYAERAQAALDQVPVEQLPPALANRLAQVQPLLKVAGPGLRLAPALPQLLGTQAPQTYMILVQNNHELRATGGFISAVSLVTLDQGQITNLEFLDSYYLDLPNFQHPPAPAPMQRYMNIPILMLRDINWSPDLPTTVKLLKALYGAERSAQLQGIITVDLHAVQLLIEALGPLELAGSTTPITGANIIEQLQTFWNRPEGTEISVDEVGDDQNKLGEWWGQRKAFMPKLAAAARQRLETGEVEYRQLLTAGIQALDERSIQLWLADRALAEPLATLAWDGALHPGADADFLALVDTNMGYNKANAAVERTVRYRVEWPHGADQPAEATAEIIYRHSRPASDPLCAPSPVYGDSYDAMIGRCYFNYLRLYVPVGSKLLALEGVEPDSVASQRAEANTQLFAGYLMVRPGEQQTVTVRYTLPPTLTPENYHLVVQRQAGTTALPVELQVNGTQVTKLLNAGRWEWSKP